MKKIVVGLSLLSFSVSFSQSTTSIIDSLFFGANGLRVNSPEVGVVIGVFDGARTSYYTLGTRQVNGNELVDSTTIFEVGSATKTFTALLLAKAIEKRKVGANDFIDNYLPKGFHLPVRLQRKVRLTDLASHQSGLPNLSSDEYFTQLLKRNPRNPFRFVDRNYLYAVLRQTDSLTNYGKYQYNNYAFSLLGDILARVYQTGYASLLSKKIIRPLRMKSTSLSLPITSNRAGLYSQRGEPQEALKLDAVNPAGGLKSNAIDLMKYLMAHLAGTEGARPFSRTRNVYYADEKMQVGLGWDIKEGYYQKDGDTFGNSMLMRYNPAKQLAVVVLLNHQNGQLARDVVDFVYGRLIKSE